MEQPVTIDLFELSFLAEACIPPVPIARSMFWTRLIDEIYNLLTEQERNQMFEWITNHDRFDMNNPDCREFYLRYNPDKQYIVEAKVRQTVGKFETYLGDNGMYKSKINLWVDPDSILSVKKKYS